MDNRKNLKLEKKEKRKMNLKKLNLTVLLVTILVLIPTIQIVYASPLSTFYLSGGIYPHGVSYTIWREGSYYYAKNAYGFIHYSGTNGSQIFQNCIDILTPNENSGGVIFLPNGEYTASFLLKWNVVIIGENQRLTKIFGCITMNNSDTIHPIRLENLFIDGYSAGVNFGVVFTGNSSGVTIKNCRVSGVKAGIYCNATNSLANVLDQVMFMWNSEIGFWIQGYFYASTIQSCNFANLDYGLIINGTYACTYLWFKDCIWDNIKYQAIIAEKMSMCHFEDCWVGGVSDGTPTYYVIFNNTIDETGCYGNQIHGGMWSGYQWQYVLYIGDDYQWTTIENAHFYNIDWQARFKVYISADASDTRILFPVKLWDNCITNYSNNTYVVLQRLTRTVNVADGGTVLLNWTIRTWTGATPVRIFVTTTVANEFASVTAINPTNFIIAIKKHDGNAGTTQDVYYIAEWGLP